MDRLSELLKIGFPNPYNSLSILFLNTFAGLV